MEIYNKHFPLELKQNKSKINKTKSPWMTKCILKSVRKKNKLYRAFLMNPNDKDRQKYTKYKNKLNHIIKVAKKMHYERTTSYAQTKLKNGLEDTQSNTQ